MPRPCPSWVLWYKPYRGHTFSYMLGLNHLTWKGRRYRKCTTLWLFVQNVIWDSQASNTRDVTLHPFYIIATESHKKLNAPYIVCICSLNPHQQNERWTTMTMVAISHLVVRKRGTVFFSSNVCFHNFNLVLLNIQTVKLESKCEAYEPWKDTGNHRSWNIQWVTGSGIFGPPPNKNLKSKISPPPQKKKTRKHPCLLDLGISISKVDKGAIAFDLPTIWAKAGWVSLSFHFTTSWLTRIWDFVQK